ncbi:lecithin-cholesterol acyltransferase-like 1 isoform X2 [Solanum dulcamara]|uniref:lecithin-cholesterol acyltransferase-like 1 isoform X2 n=1 Tax=Solanum dulcamara TaxID=45834 RepID=UPI002485C0A3|nr:lecithin-cholesterol acyltransferase-like 1 isoform X2 [Solanum dulcamara]
MKILSIFIMSIMLYTNCQAISTNLHPLILIPGAGGNQLEARLTSKYKSTSLLCNKWYPLKKDSEAYMEPLVKALEELGYRDGENLFGAPYDFRYGLAAEGHPSRVGSKFLKDLKGLIENASNSNGGKPVILVSHSLGGLYVHQLLVRNLKSWSQKYIKHFIALSTPWGGTVVQMLTFASGYTLGLPLVNPLLVREEQRSSESNMWLLPSPKVFTSKTPLVVTPNVGYSAHDIPKFLKDIGFSQGVMPYTSRILPLVDNFSSSTFPDDQVPITCIIGCGIKTPETLLYGSDGDFDKRPEIVYGDGDGTVNMVSLLSLESNKSTHQHLEVLKLQGVSHTGTLTDEVALEKIVEKISCINSDISLVSKA